MNKRNYHRSKRWIYFFLFLCMLFMVKSIGVEASTVETELSESLPNYPFNGQSYWVVFREGYRNSRIEMSTCDISGNVADAYIKWDRNLILQNGSSSGSYHQYRLTEDGVWEQIGTYGKFTDYATSVIASNLDIYDSSGKLILAKSKLQDYPNYYSKRNIKNAKLSSIGKQYYTGKAIKPTPKVTYNGKYLYKDVDYSLSYKNNKKVGTATIIIKGKGDYKGSKAVTFKIVKKANGFLKLSKSSVTLSLAGNRTYKLKATKKNISSKVKWKSSDNNIVEVKNGSLTARKTGKVTITATAGTKKATCKVEVKDTATKTISLTFKTFDEWSKTLRSKETGLVFGGKTAINPDGSTYYTGNIIVKRQIQSYKKIKVKVSINTPGYYKTVYLKLPNKIKYTLHRHNLKMDTSSESVGKIMVGLVEQQVVYTQICSCGYKVELKWDIPIDVPEKLSDGETYVVNTISRMI